MKRLSLLLAVFLFFCPATFTQQAESDTQTMQAVLVEIRQLRRDMQTAVTAARRAQIVIFRFHEQTAMVERASETLENTKNTLAQVRWQRQQAEAQIKSSEEMRDRSENEEERKRLDEGIKMWQGQLSEAEINAQELTSKEMEEEADLAAARGKLEQLENELDHLDQDLGQTAVQTSNR